MFQHLQEHIMADDIVIGFEQELPCSGISLVQD